MPALGERFRAAREARGLTLSDVSEQIRIRSVYLAAIEDENWPAIGAPVYVRGFLRTYARFLGLDPEEHVAAFNSTAVQGAAAPAQATPGTSYRMDTAPPSRHLAPMIWVASLVAMALIAFLVYNEATFRQAPPATVAVAGSPAVEPSTMASALTDGPTAAVSPSPLPAGADTQSLKLHLSAPSWVRVTVDGSVSMEGTFPAGTERSFHGKTAKLRIGNAGGVEIIVDGKNLGTLGASGDVVDRSFVL
jgi:cytoskeletal protein RodZ